MIRDHAPFTTHESEFLPSVTMCREVNNRIEHLRNYINNTKEDFKREKGSASVDTETWPQQLVLKEHERKQEESHSKQEHDWQKTRRTLPKPFEGGTERTFFFVMETFVIDLHTAAQAISQKCVTAALTRFSTPMNQSDTTHITL